MKQTSVIRLDMFRHTMRMRADELMQKMWDKDVVGIADQNKRLTAEEVLAARKETQPRRYAEWL